MVSSLITVGVKEDTRVAGVQVWLGGRCQLGIRIQMGPSSGRGTYCKGMEQQHQPERINVEVKI